MDFSKIKIVADSSADMVSWGEKEQEITALSVPLKIITSQKEYVDDENLDVDIMVDELKAYSGRSSSSCPNPSDYLVAFGEAQYIFCITITSGLSGSYNSACIAKEEYEDQHPERKVCVIDSLSAGPELKLLVEKLIELIKKDKEFYEVCEAISEYQKRTELLFMLESMKNLANNGRVSPFVAKLAGILGIRVIGKASDVGTLEQLEKPRGESRALPAIFKQMRSFGYKGGKVRIAHCRNINAANELKKLIKCEYKGADIEIYSCRALCSFYAELGGMLVGFEK